MPSPSWARTESLQFAGVVVTTLAVAVAAWYAWLTRAMLGATKVAANAAQKAADVAETTLKVTQRACLTLVGWALPISKLNEPGHDVQFDLWNQGPTRATLLRTGYAIHFEAAFPGDEIIKVEMILEPTIAIEPRTCYAKYFHLQPLSPSVFAELQSGARDVWLAARADYVDVFGVEHMTCSCVRWDRTAQEFRTAPSRLWNRST